MMPSRVRQTRDSSHRLARHRVGPSLCDVCYVVLGTKIPPQKDGRTFPGRTRHRKEIRATPDDGKPATALGRRFGQRGFRGRGRGEAVAVVLNVADDPVAADANFDFDRNLARVARTVFDGVRDGFTQRREKEVHVVVGDAVLAAESCDARTHGARSSRLRPDVEM